MRKYYLMTGMHQENIARSKVFRRQPPTPKDLL